MKIFVRIIPLTIAMAALTLAVKIADIVHGGDIAERLLIASVEAETADGVKPVEKHADAKPKEEKPKEGKPGAESSAGEKSEKSEKPNPNVSEKAPPSQDRRFTEVEIQLLQNLSKRREELEQWEKNIQVKEAALSATESSINDKISQIENMKREVADLLNKYNEQEDAKIRSLVKIYENMKPKDAARIFEELEMPIALLVIDKMSEKKAAPLLASMDPKKAKQLTVELAEQRKLQSARLPVAPTAAPAASVGAPAPAPAQAGAVPEKAPPEASQN